MTKSAFSDQVVLITGASRGLGRALAGAFSAAGARVVLFARDAGKLRETVAALPGPSLAVTGDVTIPADAERAVAATLERFGQLDILVNNAGIGYCAAVAEADPAVFRAVMETNFFGAFHFTKAALPHFRQRRAGLFIQISSLNGFAAVPMGSAYCASKFALEAFSQSLRIEVAREGIRVLIVRPGVTNTEFFDHAKDFRQKNPFPLRHLMPAEVAARHILRAAAAGKRDLVLTAEGKLLWWLKKLSPALTDRILLSYVKERRS